MAWWMSLRASRLITAISLFATVLCNQLPYAESQACTIDHQFDGNFGFIIMPEGAAVGYRAFNFTVLPPGSTVIWECDTQINPQLDDMCYYLERISNETIALKEQIDIENDAIIFDVDDNGQYLFFPYKDLTCFSPEGTPGQRVEIRTTINNVNEHVPKPIDVEEFITTVPELTLTGTELVFDPPIVITDGDVKEQFTCDDPLESDVPFAITCTTETADDNAYLRKSVITLTVNSPPNLDYEERYIYSFNVTIKDKADTYGKQNTGYIPITVNLLDLDDRNPEFEYISYTAEVREEQIGVVDVLPSTILALDGDSLDAPIVYGIDEENAICSENIDIDSETGVVSIIGPLNFLGSCVVIVKATEEFNTQRVTTVSMTVSVIDINNECPGFTESSYSGQIEPGEEFVLKDGSSDERLVLVAMDMDELFIGTFQDNSTNFDTQDIGEGQLYLKALAPDDLDDGQLFNIVVTVTDENATVPCTSNQTSVMVTITNLSPIVDPVEPTYYVNERAEPGTFVLQVSANNADGSPEGIYFRLTTANADGLDIFTIDELSGNITVISNATDAESDVNQYVLVVEAQDKRNSGRTRVTSTSVTMVVLDINDNPPIFSSDFYNISIPENFTPLAPIITIQASDEDILSELTYSFDGESLPFEIDQMSGVIVTTRHLDRDPPDGIAEYMLTAVVSDGAFVDRVQINITITDVNDNAPVFMGSPIEVHVNESDTEVQVQLYATDMDDGRNGIVMYFIESWMDHENITIDNTTGLLTFTGPFDREQEADIVITVRAEDHGVPARSNTVTVSLKVLDENDEQPRIVDNQCLSVVIAENSAVGTAVCAVLAVDDDEPNNKNSQIEYYLEGENADLFSINKNSDTLYGEITVDSQLDREAYITNPLNITIKAMDMGIPTLSSSLEIFIMVSDVNDNPPEFAEEEYTVFIADDRVQPGQLVFSVDPSDSDLTPGNIVLCSISSLGEDDKLFIVNSNGTTCMLYSTALLELRPSDPYTLTLTAYNPDNTSLVSDRSEASISIYISDSFCLIDIDPEYYMVTLKANDVIIGEPVVTINASSSCGNNGIEDGIGFNITNQEYYADLGSLPVPSSAFSIDPMTGSVIAVSNETPIGLYSLTIIAFNTSASDPERTIDTGMVEITIIPENNTAPTFMKEAYTEKLQVPKQAGHLVLDMSTEAMDRDAPILGIGQIVFSKLSEFSDGGEREDLFIITPEGQIILDQDLDLDQIDIGFSVNLTIRVEDKAVEPLSDTAFVVIDIALPYTTPPVFTNSTCQNQTVEIPEDVAMGTTICNVKAEAASSITYGLTDETSFGIDNTEGRVFTRKMFNYEMPEQDRQYALVVYAENTEGQRAYTTIEVVIMDINDNAPMFQQDNYMFSITEDTDVADCMVYVGQVKAEDADSFINNTDIEYTLQGEQLDFDIDPQTGIISTTSCIDREDTRYTNGTVKLMVVAENTFSAARLNDTAFVTIVIEDVNDNPPVFVRDDYEVSLGVLLPYDDLLIVSAVDEDQGDNNGAVFYVFASDQSPDVYEYFTINRTTGIISSKNTTKFNNVEYYEISINVEAWDQGSPPLMDEAFIHVIVADNYLNEPVFRDENRIQSLDIEENLFPGCIVFEPPVFPNGSVPIYSIVEDTSGNFFLNCSYKPELCLSTSLDREEEEVYRVLVQADLCNKTHSECPTDCTMSGNMQTLHVGLYGYKSMQERSQTTLEILVIDINDDPPVVDGGGYWPGSYHYVVGVSDNVAFNTSILQIQATDEDINSNLKYAIELDTTSNTSCTIDHGAIDIDNNGGLLVKDALYQYLDVTNYKGQEDGETACEYIISVTDVATLDEYQNEVSVRAKITILYVFEHAIIRFDSPPDEVAPKATEIASCLSDILIGNHVVVVQDVRPHLIDESANLEQTIIDPESTDLWVYTIDNTTGSIVTYLEFERIWEASTGKLQCEFDLNMLYVRGVQPSRLNDPPSHFLDVICYALIIIGSMVGLGGLLCMCLLFETWDSMELQKGQHIAATIETWSTKDGEEDIEGGGGAVNLGYDAQSTSDVATVTTTFQMTDGKKVVMKEGDQPRYVDTTVGAQDAPEVPSRQMTSLADSKEGNVILYESQELTMDVFNDETADDDEFLITSKVPTVAHVMVGDSGEVLQTSEGSVDLDDNTETTEPQPERSEVKSGSEGVGVQSSDDGKGGLDQISELLDKRFIPIDFPDGDEVNETTSIKHNAKDTTPLITSDPTMHPFTPPMPPPPPPPSPPPPPAPIDQENDILSQISASAGQDEFPPPPPEFNNVNSLIDVYNQYF